MTAPVRIDLAALSANELAALRDALRTRPGQRTPETLAALAERDRLVRELAARCYPGLCRHQQSMRIHDELARYASTTWTRTRADLVCRHRDDRRRLIWQILKMRGGHVPAVRTINDILAWRG
ncbi:MULTISPECIES: hypothetical protein [unclassified Bradyrhizobium]|uniref:hypothetical protein n=1 Tax=unclassified Bradyrhizobium TaxID=2631580 RepID=UPI001FFAACD2|nr:MULTISPECIES: hypothetical protein [unclassified Bradyrhizobium]MCK1669671.1 hypothetical protein [Bradyrhizobium sp. 153]MCK1757511.1 hypothetical protein [Bradyrhizobium sp. 137]